MLIYLMLIFRGSVFIDSFFLPVFFSPVFIFTGFNPSVLRRFRHVGRYRPYSTKFLCSGDFSIMAHIIYPTITQSPFLTSFFYSHISLDQIHSSSQ